MKRTVEIVLGIIGALIYVVFAVIGGLMIWLQNNQDVIQQSLEQTLEQNPEMNMADFDTVLASLAAGGWLIMLVSLAALALGIIAMVLLRGNRNPKAAGIIFISTAIITSIITLGIGIIPAAFYLIAGIMCLARKPPRLL